MVCPVDGVVAPDGDVLVLGPGAFAEPLALLPLGYLQAGDEIARTGLIAL